MLKKFSAVPQELLEGIQLDAGVLLRHFEPKNPSQTDLTYSNVICITTGGIQISAVPSYSDLGADIDNCPNNMKELKLVESWDVSISFTALDAGAISLAIGAVGHDDYDWDNGEASGVSFTLETDLQRSIWADTWREIWWVGSEVDSNNFVAIKISNALSTGGFNLQTTKAGKGQFSVTLTGHASIADPDKMPFVIYHGGIIISPTGATGAT